MIIKSFWAKGYRSLLDLRLDDLGPFNIFYGPNGSGKSNILAAMQLLFAILAYRTRSDASFKTPWEPVGIDWMSLFVQSHDRCHIERIRALQLGVTLQSNDADRLADKDWPRFTELTVAIEYDWDRRRLTITRLDTDDHAILDTLRDDGKSGVDMLARMPGFEPKGGYDPLWRLKDFVHELAQYAFTLIGAERYLQEEKAGSEDTDLATLFAVGRFKEAVSLADRATDPVVRQRYKQFKELMQGEPFERPPFELTEDRRTRRIDIVENLDPSEIYHGKEVPLHLAGLGIVQVYSIVAQVMLRGPRAVGIEEPEAHLHAPTSGIALRQLLARLVDEHYIDQLFIATHSNLFDLDQKRYFDVKFDRTSGTTVTAEKELHRIDERHLYEPGPAKHALEGFLRYLDDDAIVFRKADGQPVSVREMLDMLQQDDPLAVEFLRDVHGAAIRAVRVQSKKTTP